MGMTLLAFGQPGFWQMIIVLAVFLLFFGSSRLPKMARSLGESLTEFKKGLRGVEDGEDEKKKLDQPQQQAQQAPAGGSATATTTGSTEQQSTPPPDPPKSE